MRVKFCGLTRPCDIDAANELMPDYAGFVFWNKSRRYVDPETTRVLRENLRPEIVSVGVFVDESPEIIACISGRGIIGMIQLHGHEDSGYISHIKALTGLPVIKAFKIRSVDDVKAAEICPADYVMADSGMGTGKVFDWSLLRGISRPYFLAGGLEAGNVGQAVSQLNPFAVDVSSGIETDGMKDKVKMSEFIAAVREGKLR